MNFAWPGRQALGGFRPWPVKSHWIVAGLMLAGVTAATAAPSCSVSAVGGVAFGAIDILSGSAVDVIGGSIQVNCSGADGAVPYTIALDAGAGPGASASVRKMQLAGDPSSTLAYSLYRSPGDRSGDTAWGTSGSALSSSLTIQGGSGANSSPVYGRVFSGQRTARAGGYSDVIDIAVAY
ncbi:MAG: hypothetical protein JWO83_1055 [Caulobacteraceae bacterium]|nr:hypothetical protein [Caulobacteraceae bacterium]